MQIKNDLWSYPTKVKFVMLYISIGTIIIFLGNIPYLGQISTFMSTLNFGMAILYGIIIKSIMDHNKIEREFSKLKEDLKDGKKGD